MTATPESEIPLLPGRSGWFGSAEEPCWSSRGEAAPQRCAGARGPANVRLLWGSVGLTGLTGLTGTGTGWR